MDKLLEELQLIKCSLLPNEVLKFIEDDGDGLLWAGLLDAHDNGMTMPPFRLGAAGGESISDVSGALIVPMRPAKFRIEVLDRPQNCRDGWSKVGFEVVMMPSPAATGGIATVSAKGDYLGRAEQERWRDIIQEKMREVEGAEYPTYELLSLHLLPLLHQNVENLDAGRLERLKNVDNTEVALSKRPLPAPQTFHALFTSHHLVSPQKRRSLQEWSSSLDVSGFAKVGYPGVIYAQGERQSVEEFVANVKLMQWLALRVRFVEPVEEVTHDLGGLEDGRLRKNVRWKEFQKVGEVVEEMKRLGREKYVTEMGIGSARVK